MDPILSEVRAAGFQIEYLVCVVNAVVDAFRETGNDTEQIWNEYKKQLKMQLGEILNCQDVNNLLEQVE